MRMKNEERTNKALIAFYDALSGMGCTNHSCQFTPPSQGSMGTNGSCNCLDHIRPFGKSNAVLRCYFMGKELKAGAN